MASSDIFLFPSWYEAFSLATIEAAACGLPILASKINGAEDFVEPGETGFFIEHDPVQIAGVLSELIDNVGQRARMGANARKLVEQHYTWDEVARLTEEAYFEYLEGTRINGRKAEAGLSSRSVGRNLPRNKWRKDGDDGAARTTENSSLPTYER